MRGFSLAFIIIRCRAKCREGGRGYDHDRRAPVRTYLFKLSLLIEYDGSLLLTSASRQSFRPRGQDLYHRKCFRSSQWLWPRTSSNVDRGGLVRTHPHGLFRYQSYWQPTNQPSSNLFTTTLRLTRSNEVSTISNGSIANTRIVNHARSRNAMVTINLFMTLSRATHEHVTIVRSALTQYILDNPRVWSRLVNWRVAKVDTNHDVILFSAQVQHVRSWQNNLPVLTAKGDLEKFCIDIIVKLGIGYDNPPSANARELFIKELPEGFFPQRSVESNKKDD